MHGLKRASDRHERQTALLEDDSLLKRAEDRLQKLQLEHNELVLRREALNAQRLQQQMMNETMRPKRHWVARIRLAMTEELILIIAIFVSCGGGLTAIYLDSPLLAVVMAMTLTAVLGYAVKLIFGELWKTR